jgi:hypothetical protein
MVTTDPPADNNRGGDFDVIRAKGQEIRVTRGEIFENKLIDVSTGESVFLRVTGGNSVIRNIGFKGLYRGDQFLISVDAGRGYVRFENIYLGDGATKEGSSSAHGPGAIYLHRGNEADVTFQRCNVQGFPNNGFHCSNTASGSGSVHFDRCFGKNNGVATFRCGGGNDRIENCVAYTDTTDYGHDDDDYLETNGRPVWVWNGGIVTITDSHFADGPYPNAIVAGANDAPGRVSFESGGYRGHIQRATGSTVDVGPDVSNDLDLSLPDGVPTTAEGAASDGMLQPLGGKEDDSDDQFPHIIVFNGSEVDEPSSYSFEAAAAVAAVSHGTSTSDSDVVYDQPVHGLVSDAADVYLFRGNITALSLCGDATVSIQHNVRDKIEAGGSLQS